MDEHELWPPLPVDGVVFERSAVKTLWSIVLCGIFCFLGVCAFLAAVEGREGVGLKGLLIGLGLMVFAPLMIVREVRSWLVRRRLIIGEDCLQVVEHLRGENRVVLQIPFANIAEFTYEESRLCVAIDLHHLDDPDTYASNEDFEKNRKSGGRHYRITFGYRRGVRAIASELKKAYGRWLEK